MESNGSFGAGFVLGFLLGVIGLIIALCIDKEKTKKGAITGFFVSLGIYLVLVVIIVCFGLGTASSIY